MKGRDVANFFAFARRVGIMGTSRLPGLCAGKSAVQGEYV